MSKKEQSEERVGVLLFNLGGPDTLEDVRPFLFNLFADPDIIRLPWRGLQKPLAWFISTQRYKKSRGYYEKIGGGSPLRKITDEQARALEGALASRGTSVRAYVGMRYWNPFIEEALEANPPRSDNSSHSPAALSSVLGFTTGSSLNRMIALAGKNGQNAAAHFGHLQDGKMTANYITALTASMSETLARFPDQDPSHTHIVFSAHSVPVSYIEEGDPYLDQTKQTVELVMERLGEDRPHTLSFQSKVGPVKWLTPATDETMRRLAREGVSQLLLVPVSFVSEHSETLYEMDILYRDAGDEAGIAHYLRVPAMNCREDFIEALAGLVERAIALDAQQSRALLAFIAPRMQTTQARSQRCACDRTSVKSTPNG